MKLGARPAAKDLPLSICLIVKNEEANLPALLESLAGLGAELIVVDTGSTDRTVQIAQSAGAKVRHFSWTGDFAAARNVSLEAATRSWVMWMDADDRLPASSRPALQALVAARPEKAWAFLVKNTTNGGATGSEFSQIRLFPNHPRIRFTGAVHEQVFPALAALGIPFEYSTLVVHHTGYIDADTVRAKQVRNREILEREVVRNGGHAITLYQLGAAHADLGNAVEAERRFRESLKAVENGDPDVHLKSLVPAYAATLFTKKEDWAGARRLLEELLDPDVSLWHPSQIAIAAQVWLRTGSIEEAVGWFEKAYTPPQAKVLLPVDPKVASVQPLQNLAEYWKGVGNEPLATEILLLLKSVLENRFPPRRAIPDAYMRHGQASRAAELYAWCIDRDGDDPALWAPLVRATAIAGDPENAARFLDAGLERWPGDEGLRALARGEF
ncbi:MAG: glycosyltransferase [Fibrobacteria bacterium]|nr:glycosyltransferase [Fibrobacteria bacterium]